MSSFASYYEAYSTAFASSQTDFLPWEDISAVLISMATWALVQRVLIRHVFQPIGKRVVIVPGMSAPKAGASKAQAEKYAVEHKKQIQKFTNAFMKLLSYSFCFGCGLYSMALDEQQYASLNGGKSWIQQGVLGLFQDWPNNQLRFLGPNKDLESPVLFHYKVVLGYYFLASIQMMLGIDGTPPKDYLAMGVHHAVTMFLIVLSWCTKLSRFGLVVVVLHDVSDPFMELAKLFLYSGKQGLADAGFAAFALVFMVSRNIVYPIYVLKVLFEYISTDEGYAKVVAIPYGRAGCGALFTLQLLHIFWGSLISKMVYEAVSKGAVGEDIREEKSE